MTEQSISNHDKSLQFYFDYLSPYAYVAWSQVHNLAQRFQLTIEPVPILLAGILNATGQKGPAEVPAERQYIFKDLCRTTRALNIPLAMPPTHPFNPLLSLRATCINATNSMRNKLTSLFFESVWQSGRDISDKNEIVRIGELAGTGGMKLLQAAQSNEAKLQLRKNTESAIAIGIFGVPTLVYLDELFWGYESFSNLERFLKGNRDVDIDLLEKWQNLKPSATRNT